MFIHICLIGVKLLDIIGIRAIFLVIFDKCFDFTAEDRGMNVSVYCK